MQEPDIVPPQRLPGRLGGVYVVPEGEVESAPVDGLRLELEGAAGDRHQGFIRPSTSREPWYPRGTTIRHGRQLSVVGAEDMAEVARRMGLPELRAEWVGATLLAEGIPRLSLLPPGTRLLFASGASVVVELINGPCRITGRAIARHFPGRDGLDLAFPREAQRYRGVVATVERPGEVAPGMAFEARVPEQWIYRG